MKPVSRSSTNAGKAHCFISWSARFPEASAKRRPAIRRQGVIEPGNQNATTDDHLGPHVARHLVGPRKRGPSRPKRRNDAWASALQGFFVAEGTSGAASMGPK